MDFNNYAMVTDRQHITQVVTALLEKMKAKGYYEHPCFPQTPADYLKSELERYVRICLQQLDKKKPTSYLTVHFHSDYQLHYLHYILGIDFDPLTRSPGLYWVRLEMDEQAVAEELNTCIELVRTMTLLADGLVFAVKRLGIVRDKQEGMGPPFSSVQDN